MVPRPIAGIFAPLASTVFIALLLIRNRCDSNSNIIWLNTCLARLERLQIPCHRRDELQYCAVLGMALQTGKTAPAKRQTQIVNERQRVLLADKDGICTEERKLDAIGLAAAKVGFVKPIRCQVKGTRLVQIRIDRRSALLPFLEEMRRRHRRLDRQR